MKTESTQTALTITLLALVIGCNPCRTAITISASDKSAPYVDWHISYKGKAERVSSNAFYMELYDSISVVAIASDEQSGIADVAIRGSSDTYCSSSGSALSQVRSATFVSKKGNGLCANNKARKTLSLSYDNIEFVSCGSGFSPTSGQMTIYATAINGAEGKTETRILIKSR